MPTLSVTELHGAMTHFPIAMIIAAFLFEIGAPLFRKPEWRVVSFWLLFTGVVGAIPSLITGWITGTQMFGSAEHPPDVFVDHRLAGFVAGGLSAIVLAWRVATKDKLSGFPLACTIGLLFLATASVSYTGYKGGAMAVGTPDAPPVQPAPAPSAQQNAIDPKLIADGKIVYQQNKCEGCHVINGQGQKAGPDLSHEGTRNADINWQIAHLKDPKKLRPNSFMPAYASLPPDQLKSMSSYLVSLK